MQTVDTRQMDAFSVQKPIPDPVSPALIFKQSSFVAALRLAISTSGLQDKQISDPLGIDPGQWSRICNGSANFLMDRYSQFRRLVGNDIALQWLANACGFELKPLASDLERENARLKEELAQERRDRETILRFVKEARL